MDQRTSIDPEEYKSILLMKLVVQEINKNPDFLPNITLGYHIFSTCSDPKKTLGYVTKVLSGEKEAPNYYCKGRGEVAGFIGDSHFHSSHVMAQLLSLYQYTQVSYRATDTRLRDGKLYPTLFHMTPDNRILYAAIIKFLQYFGWNWVGIILSNDGSSDEESQELSKILNQHGICVDYIFKLKPDIVHDTEGLIKIWKSKAKVIIACETFASQFYYFSQLMPFTLENITFIFPPPWSKLPTYKFEDLTAINCSFIFLWAQRINVQFENPEYGISFSRCHTDPILEDIWIRLFSCLSPNPLKNYFFNLFYNISAKPCRGVKYWKAFDGYTTLPFYAYRAVYVLANALHWMYMKKNKSEQNGFQHRLHKYMRNVHYVESTGVKIYFNERREVATDLSLESWVFANSTYYLYYIITIIRPGFVPEMFTNLSNPIFWKKGKIPVSRCSDPCLPGSRKKFGSSIHKCCYECVPCPEGEISNISDSENCMKCPDEEWPNEKKDCCVPKLMEFLSYTDDTIVAVFLAVSILCCLLTGFILGIFIHYQDTPIVKANNRNLSYLLLVSIMLSFLCVFLFFGHPVDVTCMLRVTSFGVIFSVAVSSLLAKSIMVCIAFKATKPGSPWRKWMGAKLPNAIICVFSLVQVKICVTWMSISPPFQDRDTHTYQGKIIIQCNEGSVIGFYSVLGYMGLLAAASFIIAFLARTLPDSFNEAKYITFSMLVFCSVWIAMIPAYLSTRGKYMVAVEVFAIVASSSGLLGCIFFPKCYIILIRPDLNTKTIIR
ncbi:vomeronasal type-2 receptor 26-like [Aquarana catesbeiana]|uniref:vomeronasal type-2 receptor 26-like n=1 Tax=Aquarana catesbeiana TaxID=8400 RepID=UPI003CCA2FDA